MVEITQDLLRKRAEHNEGMLSTLEEVSLHQQNIRQISNLDVYCRHLKILYLQNNLIEEISGLLKLKELEYLNLAVNSIAKLEGLKRCESLNKLDLTLNFIDVEDLQESIEELEWCENLQEIYFTGNPCTDWEHFREYVIAKLPQVMRLDNDEVTRSERLVAKTNLAEREAELAQIGENSRAKKEYDKREGIKPNCYTREERWQYYVEEKEKKQKEEEDDKKTSMFKDYNDLVEANKINTSPDVYTPDGNLRQCNYGRYNFSLDESQDCTKLIFNMEVPKFMNTDSLNVDLQPQYVRVDVKGKVTQIRFDEEILVERSTIQRSTTTGWLCITMPKVNIDQIQADKLRMESYKAEWSKKAKLRALEIAEEEAREARIAELQERARRDAARDRGEPDPITQEEETKTESNDQSAAASSYKPASDPSFLIEKSANQKPSQRPPKEEFVPDFDLDEVPDLE